jgi:hypothetical protein
LSIFPGSFVLTSISESRTDSIPDSAKASVKGEADVDMYEPISWQSASIPLDAVTFKGHDNVSSGSTKAMSGVKFSCLNEFLNPLLPTRPSTAFLVASLPVPAVVGTAIKGIFVPSCTLPSPTPSTYAITDSVFENIADMAFPASITLPPPTATTTSISKPRYSETALSICSGEGSPETLTFNASIRNCFSFLVIHAY